MHVNKAKLNNLEFCLRNSHFRFLFKVNKVKWSCFGWDGAARMTKISKWSESHEIFYSWGNFYPRFRIWAQNWQNPTNAIILKLFQNIEDLIFNKKITKKNWRYLRLFSQNCHKKPQKLAKFQKLRKFQNSRRDMKYSQGIIFTVDFKYKLRIDKNFAI